MFSLNFSSLGWNFTTLPLAPLSFPKQTPKPSLCTECSQIASIPSPLTWVSVVQAARALQTLAVTSNENSAFPGL